MNTNQNWHGTTIVLIRKGNQTIVAGDGQVSLGNTVLKSKAKKVRKIEKRNVIAGFAGSTADALTLFERLALGAAKGKFNLFNKFLVIGCFGNLTAKVFFLLVTNLEIFEFFFKSKTNVIGPGQNFLYSLRKFLLKLQSFFKS